MRARSTALAAAFSCLAASTVLGQVPPGQYLALVRAPAGEAYYCDPASGKATALTVPTVWQNDWANCVTMVNAVIGYAGTFNNPAVYSITVTGTSIAMTQLNTTALTGGNECTQITRVGGMLYVAQWDKLWSVPVAGGPATLVADLTQVTGWPAAGIANAMTSDGVSKLFLAVWPGGDVFVHDLTNQTTSHLLTLPASKLNSTSTFSPVNAQMQTPAPLGNLAVVGLYGDVCIVDTRAAKVTAHYYHTTPTATGYTTSKDAMAENLDTGDWAIGTRDGVLDVLVPIGNGQLARRHVDGVGSNATPSMNRVVGVWYHATGGNYKAFGAGCAGTGGFVPTSASGGAPVQGNKSFAFGIETANGNSAAVLILGATNTTPFPIDLTAAGAAGCFLRTDLLLALPTVTTGIAPGFGQGRVQVPLPSQTLSLFTQWATLDPVNGLGLVMSDARQLQL